MQKSLKYILIKIDIKSFYKKGVFYKLNFT